MRARLLGSGVLVGWLSVSLTAQTPGASQPASPRPGQGATPPTASPGTTATAARTPRQLDIMVTDPTGASIGNVHVRASGAVEREGTTDDRGALRLTNMRAGTYRLRFDGEGFVAFEREVTIAATGRVAPLDVALTPEPPKPVVEPPPPPPPAPEPEAKEPPRPTGEPRTLQVPEFWEVNPLGRSEPQKASVMGCTGFATTRLLQIREPMTGRSNADADETLYVVAGEATITMAGSERPLEAGGLAVIPRGTTHNLSRRGRTPVVFVSVLSGPVCDGAGAR